MEVVCELNDTEEPREVIKIRSFFKNQWVTEFKFGDGNTLTVSTKELYAAIANTQNKG